MTPAERYAAGESSATLAREAGVTPATMRHRLRAQGVQMRAVGGTRTLTPEQEVEVLRRLALGEPRGALADLFGVSKATIQRISAQGQRLRPGRNGSRRAVEERWGYPFWEVVRDFAEQGLNRSQVAQALGYSPKGFQELLVDDPENDPFESSNIVAGYVRDTGEGLQSALSDMAARGFTFTEAARAIGFKSPRGLRFALEARGIPDPGFTRRVAKAKPPKKQWNWTTPRVPSGGPHPWRQPLTATPPAASC